MRRLALLLLTLIACGACSTDQAPGAPLTDITATNTENTGAFSILGRSMEGGVLRLKVQAADAAEADEVARHVVYQVRHTAARGVIVEVYGAGGDRGRVLASAESYRREGRTLRAPGPSAAVPSPADRRGVPGQQP